MIRSVDADGGIIEYQYDAVGNLIARISPSQSLVYSHDARNRMESVTRTVDGEAPATTTYEYDQVGNRTAMTTGGVRNEYSYDRRHRLTSLLKKTAAGALLLAMNYTVDASGLRTGVEETDASGIVRNVAYAYDATKRLISETIDHREDAKDRLSQWTYDAVGNRLSQSVAIAGASPQTSSYAYDANDRLLTESGAVSASYSYDANGNTQSKTGPDGTTSYQYNDANRLIEAITPHAALAYAYTADGLRASQTVTASGGSPITTQYVHDTAYPFAQVIEEYTAEGANPRQLAATFTIADELVSQTRYDAAGAPVTAFVQADGFGSTRWLTDGTGQITDSIDFDAFGNEVARSGNTALEHLYRGERWDASLAAYDLRARLYTPANGRFLTQDSFAGFASDPRSLHKYAYTHNDPVNGIDPSGHMTLLGISQGISVRMISLAIAYPRLASVASFVMGAVVPMELQMSMPQTNALTGISGHAALVAVHELSAVRSTLLKYGRGYWQTGFEFERWVAKILRVEKSNLPVLNGQAMSSNVKGSAVIDFIYRSSILEAKISTSTMKKNQAEQLAMYAAQQGLGLTYLFARKPSAAEIATLERWVGGVAPNMEVKVNWIFPF
jgi:RHS repeat-associated protein